MGLFRVRLVSNKAQPNTILEFYAVYLAVLTCGMFSTLTIDVLDMSDTYKDPK